MATTHLKDIVAAVDTYTDQQGNEKKRWQNVGKLLRNDKGDFLVFDRTFNPAGMPGTGDVFLSLFDPKPKQGQQSQGGQSGGGYDSGASGGGYGGGNSGGSRDLGDSIPFAPEWRI